MIMNRLDYLAQKLSDDDYNPKLTKLIYDYCFSPINDSPVGWDKLNLYGYGIVYRSNRGAFKGNIFDSFDPKYDDYQVIVLINNATNELSAIVLPPFRPERIMHSYLIRGQDYFFNNLEKSSIVKDSFVMTNSLGDQLLIVIHELDDDNPEPPLSEVVDAGFIEFSKFCVKLRKQGKNPELDDVVDAYNKK